MNIISHSIDPSAWREEFFPPVNAWRLLVRLAGMVVIFLLWVALALATTVGLMHLGVMLELAALLGVLTPPLLVIVLNIAGVFNRPRGHARTLKTFRRWVAGPAGQRRGLVPAHLGRVSPQGNNALMIEVTPAWLEQPADKRLADVSHWFIVWDFCRDDCADRTALNLTVRDSTGQDVGGSHADDGGTVWVLADHPFHSLDQAPPRRMP
jgi:hypothetical protein